MADRFWESYRIGESWTSQGRTVFESDIAQFARVTGEFRPLHVNREYAACHTPFGASIAQRALVLSMTMGIAWQVKMNPRNLTYGVDNVTFPHPLFAGDTIRVHGQVTLKEPYPKRPQYGVVIMRYEAITQRSDIALTCDHKMLIEREVVS